MLGRRSTRDIAVAAEAIAQAHIEGDREIAKRFEEAFVEQRHDRQAMHQENKQEFALIHERINKLTDRVAGMPLKIVGIVATLVTLVGGLLQLLWHGLPHP